MPTLPQLAVIVPYRNRPEQLSQFVPHIAAYFARDKIDNKIPHRITIVEQAGNGPFNRGYLKNIGVLLNPQADYFCFHDVDYLPIWADYQWVDTPTRLIWYGAETRPIVPGKPDMLTHDYDSIFGGVVMMNRDNIELVNGYGNLYWGWGYEDFDLRIRCEIEGLRIAFKDGTYQPLPHVNEGYQLGAKPTPINLLNQTLFQRRASEMRSGTQVHKSDGLTTASFTIRQRDFARNQKTNEILTSVEKVIVELTGQPSSI